MHIVMLSEDYLPNIGGVATHVYYLSQNLVKKGHVVTIITKNNKRYKKYITEVYDNLTIVRIPIGKLRKIDNILYSLRASKYINNMVRTEKIDVLHWHTLNKDSRVIKYLNKEYPIIYTNHLSWFRNLYYQGKQKKIQTLISYTDGIICPSKETKEITTKIFPNLKCK
ncbi:glycosyltransferase, partial [Enterococcus hirae]|nr:glycosyltransferase [Enterococcus hirae]